jgi:hypothetical protein
MTRRLLSLLAFTSLVACGDKETTGDGEGDGDTDSDTDVDTDTGEVPPTDCEILGLEARAFDATEPSELRRHEPAGDLSVPLRDGSTWTLSEQWSGCESYLFLRHDLTISDLDDATYWSTGVDELIERSPRNVHYFFVVEGSSEDEAEEYGGDMEDWIGEALADLDEEDRLWWEARLHVVAEPSRDVDGLVEDMFRAQVSYFGWGIDREQKIRTLGYFPHIEGYDSALNAQGLWPFELRLFSAAYEAEYFNFEAERQARLDAVDADIVEVFGGDVIEQYEDGVMSLPDAATMSTYDTLELDIRMECPDKDAQEISNCGAWDYLAHAFVCNDSTATDTQIAELAAQACQPRVAETMGACSGDAAVGCREEADCVDAGGTCDGYVDGIDADRVEGTCGDPYGDEIETDFVCKGDGSGYTQSCACNTEMARFITTYHRESRWVVDASHALAWLQDGGDRRIRYSWAPSWNVQPTGVTFQVRLSNQGKGMAPREIIPLFTGGGFNADYNTRDAISAAIPADAAMVEFRAITTGHGMNDGNCAEFCDQEHAYTVGGGEWVQEFDDPGIDDGCAQMVGEGVVPNQAGTWWFGRGGWCPGMRVDPFTVDVTSEATPGSTVDVSYHATQEGSEPSGNRGNIVHNSWLVVYK